MKRDLPQNLLFCDRSFSSMAMIMFAGLRLHSMTILPLASAAACSAAFSAPLKKCFAFYGQGSEFSTHEKNSAL